MSTPWQHKALTKMLGLQYKICYDKGYENKVADALSRVQAPAHQEVLAVYQLQPVWFQQVIDGYSSSTELQELLAELSMNSTISPFSLKNGVIRYKSRIWLAGNNEAQHNVIQALDSSPLGGH